MDRYIYCENDFEEAMREALKEMFGYDLREFIVEKSIENLKNYTNLYRFYDRNCPGCVCGNTECDFAYGRDKAKDAWEKAKKGELFDCPVRVNGTMILDNPRGGLKEIDISDRKELPYPIITEESK
uniref:Uncharacterized protein n=1 Tax=viral metagenome TaxID=1070528 RepID=A0A6M3LMU9_9ZZZZ